MRDEESLSLWDHMTGEAFDGKLKGERMEWWPISLTTVKAARHKYPDIILLTSKFRSPKSFLLKSTSKNLINGKGFIPPGFNPTMAENIDPRLGKLVQGLGIIVDDVGKYYPADAIPIGGSITDVWADGRALVIERGAIDGVPFATWADEPDSPMQLLTRWYGFSFTYPGCDIYGQ